MGRPRTLPDPEPRPCEWCGADFTPARKRWRQRFCCKRHAQLAALAAPPDVRSARGSAAGTSSGRSRRASATTPYLRRGTEYEHRLLAAEMLGRPLLPGEVVHHVNGDKRDNRPANLRVLRDQREHNRIHHERKAAV